MKKIDKIVSIVEARPWFFGALVSFSLGQVIPGIVCLLGHYLFNHWEDESSD